LGAWNFYGFHFINSPRSSICLKVFAAFPKANIPISNSSLPKAQQSKQIALSIELDEIQRLVIQIQHSNSHFALKSFFLYIIFSMDKNEWLTWKKHVHYGYMIYPSMKSGSLPDYLFGI
jgi:hypothetical protein